MSPSHSHSFVLVIAAFFVMSFCCMISCQGGNGIPDYKNADLPVEKRIEDLLKRMTLEEKLAQIQCLREITGIMDMLEEGLKEEIIQQQYLGNSSTVTGLIRENGLGGLRRKSAAGKDAAETANALQKFISDNTRLGIPLLLHGEAENGSEGPDATLFPQPIGLAATWDPAHMEKVSNVIATEIQSKGYHQVLSPVINIVRDVRWGRTGETYGEDTYLTSKMGIAFCKSFTNKGVVTTPKHFVANIGNGGLDSNPIYFSERLLREIYFPAYKACFDEGGARSVMIAFNALDGIPCIINKWLMTDILKDEWGFKGYTVCDYDGIEDIYSIHHTAADLKDAAIQAINAGLDREMPDPVCYGKPLLEAVKEGSVLESTIDNSVRRILRVKFELGLFEDPYVDPEYADKINGCDEHVQLAYETTQKSIVLLKNENKILPLDKNIGSIAVIGQCADIHLRGGYSPKGVKNVSILEGIQGKVSSKTKVYHEIGTDYYGIELPPVPSEYFVTPDGQQGLLGEYFNNMKLEGEPAFTRVDKQLDFTWGKAPGQGLGMDNYSARWTGKLISPVSGMVNFSITSGDGIRFYFDGRLILESWFERNRTTDVIPLKLEKGREYDIKVEFYEHKWGSNCKLGWDVGGFKQNEMKKIEKAANTARKSDVAVIVTRINEGEFLDRSNLDLPGFQEDLIREVAATGTPTVVILLNGSAVTMNNWLYDVQAVVEAWYTGEKGGDAVADVIFGDYNPGGKLPITFPKTSDQLPLYYNHTTSGRGFDYFDMSRMPLFPFGHGLSYTEFEYSNLKIYPKTIKPYETVTVSLDVQNTGDLKGDEVVQLYIHDVVGSVSRPYKALKGFERITLKPGEKKMVTFELTPKELSLLDVDLNEVVEPGTFDIMIGSSSQDIRLKSNFDVVSP